MLFVHGCVSSRTNVVSLPFYSYGDVVVGDESAGGGGAGIGYGNTEGVGTSIGDGDFEFDAVGGGESGGGGFGSLGERRPNLPANLRTRHGQVP